MSAFTERAYLQQTLAAVVNLPSPPWVTPEEDARRKRFAWMTGGQEFVTDTDRKNEVDAIETAYFDEVGNLFRVLCSNALTMGSAFDEFQSGLANARRCRE